MKSLRVSFDYDGTLSKEDVQKFAKTFIDKGVDVWIVTTRWDESSKTDNPSYYEEFGDTWSEVRNIAKKLGISPNRVVFTNHTWKESYFRTNKDFIWHLDDNPEEFEGIRKLGIFPINVNGHFKNKCNRLLVEKFKYIL